MAGNSQRRGAVRKPGSKKGATVTFEPVKGGEPQTIEAAIVGAGAEYLELSTGRDWLTDVVGFATGRRARHRAGSIGRVLS